MVTLINKTNKVLHIALVKPFEIKGIKTSTVEILGSESMQVPDGVIQDKYVKKQIDKGVLKTDKKTPKDDGSSSKYAPKSGFDKGKDKSSGGSDSPKK